MLCEVSAGQETFDLTPLIKQSGHHLAIPDLPATSSADSANTQGTFYINVCRPLNPIFNTLCPAGAAACRELAGSPPQVNLPGAVVVLGGVGMVGAVLIFCVYVNCACVCVCVCVCVRLEYSQWTRFCAL